MTNCNNDDKGGNKIEKKRHRSAVPQLVVVLCLLFLAFVGGVWVGDRWRTPDVFTTEEVAAIEAMIKEGGIDVDIPPLILAIRGGHFSIVKKIVDYGANVNATIDGGVTPLHAAAAYDRVEIAQYLVSHGADVHAKDILGRTPLDWAKEHENVAIAQYLSGVQ